MMVVPLKKALYGHPQSGSHWEQKCEVAIDALGFKKVGECGEWRSCYFHSGKKVYLKVYVDDFKMAGPPDGLNTS